MKSPVSVTEYKQAIFKNEPAFPQAVVLEGQMIASTGISIRDYFAAKALSGLTGCFDNTSVIDVVATAYQYADAMLAEREKGQ